ncbi:hypothetical protein [Escherichia coli]|uniref:hypothetical protein n=1 Tax=Escherichia coli TaxID=562 RepID=UPI003B4376EB
MLKTVAYIPAAFCRDAGSAGHGATRVARPGRGRPARGCDAAGRSPPPRPPPGRGEPKVRPADRTTLQ